MFSLSYNRSFPAVPQILEGDMISFENDERILIVDKKFELDYPTLSLNNINDWMTTENFESFKSLNLGFVLFIFEKNSQNLKIWRDFFGLYSIFYTTENETVTISNRYSELIGKVTFKPDNEFIGDYLNSNFDSNTIAESTALQNIKRVLPGHELILSKKNIELYPLTKVYTFNKIPNDFDSIFENGIDKLLEVSSKTGSHLSGGLDSGLITVKLSQKLKNNHSFLLDTGHENTEDKDFAVQLAQNNHTELNILMPENLNVLSAKNICKITGQPELLLFSSHYFIQINKAAKSQNLNQLLNGHGGDAILGYGFEYLDFLFNNNDLEKLSVALFLYYEKRKEVLKKYFDFKDYKAFVQDFLLRKIKLEFRKNTKLKTLKKAFKLGLFFKLNPLKSFSKLYTFLKKYYHKKTINSTLTSLNYGNLFLQNGNIYQKQTINSNFVALGVFNLETLNAISEVQKIEQRYPFLNHNLLEYSVFTPLEVNFDHGLGRGIIRKALKKHTPPSFYNRVTKGDFYEFALHSFLTLWQEYKPMLTEDHTVWKYADKKRFENEIIKLTNNNFTSKQSSKELWYCQRVIFLALWFDVYA